MEFSSTEHVIRSWDILGGWSENNRVQYRFCLQLFCVMTFSSLPFQELRSRELFTQSLPASRSWTVCHTSDISTLQILRVRILHVQNPNEGQMFPPFIPLCLPVLPGSFFF